MKAKLSLSAKVARARVLIDETFKDLQESVEEIESAIRGFLGEDHPAGDDPTGVAGEVLRMHPRRGRPRKVTPPPRKSSGAPRAKRTPEQRARMARAQKESWARRHGSKSKAQVAAGGALKQSAAEAAAEKNEKARAEERKRRTRIDPDEVFG